MIVVVVDTFAAGVVVFVAVTFLRFLWVAHSGFSSVTIFVAVGVFFSSVFDTGFLSGLALGVVLAVVTFSVTDFSSGL